MRFALHNRIEDWRQYPKRGYYYVDKITYRLNNVLLIYYIYTITSL